MPAYQSKAQDFNKLVHSKTKFLKKLNETSNPLPKNRNRPNNKIKLLTNTNAARWLIKLNHNKKSMSQVS